jgi:acetyl-CoA carboxylase biotin carboxyl carrier protein
MKITSPAVGIFRSRVTVGALVREGEVVGELDVLGRRKPIVVPAGMRGAVVTVATQPVDFGAALVTIDPSALGEAAATAAEASQTTASTGPVFRSPMSGRFYRRSAPDKPAFVEVGTELQLGATVCLLEVMKTFNRVTYGGAGLPERARVEKILVADGDDVNAGDPLLALS